MTEVEVSREEVLRHFFKEEFKEEPPDSFSLDDIKIAISLKREEKISHYEEIRTRLSLTTLSLTTDTDDTEDLNDFVTGQIDKGDRFFKGVLDCDYAKRTFVNPGGHWTDLYESNGDNTAINVVNFIKKNGYIFGNPVSDTIYYFVNEDNPQWISDLVPIICITPQATRYLDATHRTIALLIKSPEKFPIDCYFVEKGYR